VEPTENNKNIFYFLNNNKYFFIFDVHLKINFDVYVVQNKVHHTSKNIKKKSESTSKFINQRVISDFLPLYFRKSKYKNNSGTI
jgi:hypothetical protein